MNNSPSPPILSMVAPSNAAVTCSSSAPSPETSNSNLVNLDQCLVCQDIASGVHYGVPACEGCKGFFRRIVSSRNVGGPCAHEVPIQITPQTRNSCQWCRLKKCCAVNMGRQRSRLGRRAKNRPELSVSNDRLDVSTDELIPLPGSNGRGAAPSSVVSSSTTMPAVYCDVTDVNNERLIKYVDEKRREFESQVSRRTRKVKLEATEVDPRLLQQQHQQRQRLPPALTISMPTQPDFNSLLQGRLSGRSVNSELSHMNIPSPTSPMMLHPSPESCTDEPPAKCLKLLQRHSTVSSISGIHSPRSPTRTQCTAPKKVWLEKSQLHMNSINSLCEQLAGPLAADKLEELYRRYAFNNAIYQLVLTACGKFVTYWEKDLNSNFANNPAYRSVIHENITLILEGHRKTFFFCEEYMRNFYQTKFNMLRVPSSGEEMLVAKNLISYIPVIIMRIVAFTKNIFGGSSSSNQPQEAEYMPLGADYRVTRSSDVICEEDRTKLVRQHTFKLVGMRFCAALVNVDEDYFIDPQQQYKITKQFLMNSSSPMLRMLSPMFLKFFDVAYKWKDLNITDNEMAFLSAICLTSPYFGVSHPENIFEDLDAIIRVHSAVIGQFFIYLRQKMVDDLRIPLDKLQSDNSINIELRIRALHRIFELFTVFVPILSIDGLHQNISSMDQMFKLVESVPPTPSVGLPNMHEPGHSVHTPVADVNTYVAGSYAYRDIFNPPK